MFAVARDYVEFNRVVVRVIDVDTLATVPQGDCAGRVGADGVSLDHAAEAVKNVDPMIQEAVDHHAFDGGAAAREDEAALEARVGAIYLDHDVARGRAVDRYGLADHRQTPGPHQDRREKGKVEIDDVRIAGKVRFLDRRAQRALETKNRRHVAHTIVGATGLKVGLVAVCIDGERLPAGLCAGC
ncbi:MAG: hypothetical protein WEB00_09830 [Dehalococcoidia bacterium]